MNNQNTWIVVILVVLAALLVGGFGMMGFGYGGYGSNYGYGMMRGYYPYGMMSGTYGIFGFAMMILVTLALVLFIVWLVKQLGDKK